MTEVADHLVDRVFPPGVAVRQWVLSMPWKVRYIFARNATLKKRALKIFLDEVFQGLRIRADAEAKAKGGAVTSVQRFGSAMNLNVHFHSLVLEGVYVGTRFYRAAPPSEEDLRRTVERVRDRIRRLLTRNGYAMGPEGGEEEPAGDEGLFDELQAASIRGLIGLSPRGGLKRVKLVGWGEFEPQAPKAGCAQADGFSIHANVMIEGAHREGIRRLCRYVLRPPFSVERLFQDVQGRRVRKPRADGTTHMILTPLEFIEKLAALVPPPKAHLVHYHGVLGPSSTWRKLRGDGASVGKPEGGCGKRRRGPKDCGSGWAELLKRSFGVDATRCPKCGSDRMRMIAFLRRPEVVRRILRAMGIDADRLERESRAAPARGLDPPFEAG
jgi:hypothetical protein